MPPVAEEEEIEYQHLADQRSDGDLRGSDEEDVLLILFKFFNRPRVSRRVRGGPDHYDSRVPLGREKMWACFSDFKHQVSPSNPNRDAKEYERLIVYCLINMSVPESEHQDIVQKVFRVVERAESAHLPILVDVWKASRYARIGPYTRPVGGRRRRGAGPAPAASSAIEGLQSLAQVEEYESIIRREPSCAVCLEDFNDVLDQQQPMTKLPCLHHFHLHCIAQCLEISNLCPLCRYAMPTEEEEED